jgi:non-ribosomal peptide synthetase component F
MVAGILGTLQAGGAYVPLDPSYPKSRLEFIVADARMKAVLTRKNLQKHFAKFDLPPCLCGGYPSAR